MTGAAHTAGPWEATDLTGRPVNDPGVMSAKHCVATVWINDISRKQAVANARLMAAAPDMLAALKNAIALADKNLSKFSGRTPENQACYDRCVAAIAKAEGRTP